MATSQEPEVQGSEEQEEMFCEVCRKKGRSRPAEGFCVDCVRYFCSSCLEYHTEFLPSHTQKDKSRMPQEVCLKPCRTHRNEIIKFYCPTCNNFFCELCKDKDHGDCSNVSHLPQLVEETDLNQKYTDAIETLENLLTEIKTREAKVCKKAESAQTLAAEARGKLHLQRDKVQSKLDASVSILERKISELETENKERIETEKYELDHLKNRVELLLSDTRRKKEANNKIDRFMSLDLVDRRVRSCTAYKVEEQYMRRYRFTASADLDKTLKYLSLGRIQPSDFWNWFFKKQSDL